ncbi:MAG: 16S rRNA (guanine(527)-N(7))-methyltransferase RsmG [Bryobacterales bacterium]|nr:16S rRNA (guanine(527)-N(7))-methyltransferase RsmG [Bryobacterales bacterium]
MFLEGLNSELAGICALSAEQGRRLFAHYELLRKWNQVVNLTRIEELGEAIERHYCEALFLAAHLPAGQLSIADIGSGAGFPGIPVAVLRPDCQITLIESHQRKAVFLKEATRDLPNVRILAKRAEDVDGSFDWGIARAVRWKDISWILGRLVTSVALLSGEATATEFSAASCVGGTLSLDRPGRHSQSSLNPEGFKLPWGKQRYLWMFHVKQNPSLD